MLVYGKHLRRDSTATEVENLAYYMDSTGRALEGAVSILRLSEFYEKSVVPW